MAIALTGLVAGCAIVPIHTPRVAGHVIDSRTGEPVAGAEIFVFNYVDVLFPGPEGLGSYEFAGRWTTTDAKGSFTFPARWDFTVPRGITRNEKLYLVLVHRDYGSPLINTPDNPAKWKSLELRIQPDPKTLEAMKDVLNIIDVCRSLSGDALSDDAWDHCCRIVYGEEACKRAGY